LSLTKQQKRNRKKMNSIFKSPRLTTVILSLFSANLIFCSAAFVEADQFPFPESSSQQRIEERQLSDGERQTFPEGRQQSGYLAHQFHERIRANEDEIRFLINEKDWLQNRIYHLQDLNEPVPWSMHNSMRIKEKKIRAAFRENSRLNELLKQERYQTEYYSGIDSGNHLLTYPQGSYSAAPLSEGFKQKLLQEIRDAGLDEWLRLTGNQGECTLENVLPILFSSGSARLADEYRVFLKKLAGLIKNYNMKIRIDGFADVDNIHTRQYPSNFELGAVRAANIVHELVRNGVRPSVFQIATTGKYRLDGKVMSDNKSLERRAEISIEFRS